MQVFSLILSQMMMMFIFIIIGYVLNKTGILPKNSDTILSKLQINVFAAAQIMYAMMSKCTVQTFRENSSLILYGFILILVGIAFAYPLGHLISGKTKGDPEKVYQKNMVVYALAYGNSGFFGNFLVYQLWGVDMLFKYSMFTFPFNIINYTWGLYIATPKSNGKLRFTDFLKAIINAPTIALVAGTLIGVTGLFQYVPDFVNTAFENASNCMGPMAMIIVGFVIGKFDTKELLLIKKNYIIALLRLIILPAIMLTVCTLLGASNDLLAFILAAFAAPVVTSAIIYPAIFGLDNRHPASMVLISTIFSVITIPILFYLFVSI